MISMLRLFSFVLLLAAATVRAEVAVPLAQDLAADGRDAAARGVAVLLVFSAEHCPYCEKLEENIIRPASGAPFPGYWRNLMISNISKKILGTPLYYQKKDPLSRIF